MGTKLKLKIVLEKNKNGIYHMAILGRAKKDLTAPTKRMATAIGNAKKLKSELYNADVVLVNNN